MKRPVILTTNHYYHIYNKSIYGYQIFNSPKEYERMLHLMQFYQWKMPLNFSRFIRCTLPKFSNFETAIKSLPVEIQRVTIVAYCLMPTHIHFLLRQNENNGIEHFMKDVQSAYSQFFNLRHNRKGPLWQGRFGNKIITSENQLTDTIDYIHFNPVKDLKYSKAELWPYSSYNLYTSRKCTG